MNEKIQRELLSNWSRITGETLYRIFPRDQIDRQKEKVGNEGMSDTGSVWCQTDKVDGKVGSLDTGTTTTTVIVGRKGVGNMIS